MKKFLAIIMAMMMLVAATGIAMADTEGPLDGGSITISDAVPGTTYKAYQILYIESYNAQKDVYSYKVTSAWGDWLKANATEYLEINDQDYAVWKGDNTPARAKAFADLLNSRTDKAAVATAKAPAATGDAQYSTVTMDGLKLGYYFVDTNLGTLCSLNTTKPRATVEEKNEKPSIEKQVEEDSTGAWGKVNDADIAQDVHFKTTVKAKKGAQNYVVHDKMDNGLSFVTGTVEITGLTKDTDYTVNEAPNDGCAFHINFVQTYLDTIAQDTDIVITYTAKLDTTAVPGTGYDNDTKLNYGDSFSTEWDTTTTYTWEMGVLKYGNGQEANVLANAEFRLLNNKSPKQVATFTKTEAGAYVFAEWKDFTDNAADPSAISWPDGSALVTGDDGKIAIDGLDADTYALRETKAPEGYNKLASDQTITISASSAPDSMTDTGLKMTQSTVTARINNNAGTELPSTGGMGTTILYIAGGVLVAAAAVLLVVKKRMSVEK